MYFPKCCRTPYGGVCIFQSAAVIRTAVFVFSEINADRVLNPVSVCSGVFIFQSAAVVFPAAFVFSEVLL